MKWISKETGIEYKLVSVLSNGTGQWCCQCDIDNTNECDNAPCSSGSYVFKKTCKMYPTSQEAIDGLLDYLISLPHFAGDRQKEEMIKKFIHLKSNNEE